MWFLPMLFWCFVFASILEISISKEYINTLICFLLSFFVILSLPLRIDYALYYLPFFYFGLMIGKNSISLKKYFNGLSTILVFLIFLSSFFVLTILNEELNVYLEEGSFSKLEKALLLSFRRFNIFIYSFVGLIFIYICVNWLLLKGHIKTNPKLLIFSNYCLGIYLFQQFILKILYYKLNWIENIPCLILPWIGLITALILSILFTHITLKLKFGRKLIG